ncbi:MAG: IS256 family transposase [Terriglobia bacterium]
MGKLTPITEQFQHFVRDLKESFWGDLNGKAQAAMKHLLEEESRRQRERYLCREAYERRGASTDYRNGYYERDFVTRFGTLRLRIARARGKSFLPPGMRTFQRRAEDVLLLIREAFLRGISTRQVGRVIAIVTGEAVSAQTVSTVTKSLDRLVRRFHEAPLRDEWVYLFLDGVSLRVRRPAGRKRVQMLVAYGVRRDGQRRLLAFQRSSGESAAAWEGFLQSLYRRGLEGEPLELIVTDGCPGLAAALQTVYPRVQHQRCWVHKMRNILEKVRKRDYNAVKADAQAIYQAHTLGQAQRAFQKFRWQWHESYPALVRHLEKDLPELLTFFHFPKHLWRKLRTTNVIERCFVEVRRRTRPMVCFVNIQSVDRIVFSIFNRMNPQWENRTLRVFTQAA